MVKKVKNAKEKVKRKDVKDKKKIKTEIKENKD